MNLRQKHSKSEKLLITDKLKEYLKSSKKRLLFSMKTRQVNVKTNYRNGFSNLLCRLCEKPGEVETEIHLMSCEKILMESDVKKKLLF